MSDGGHPGGEPVFHAAGRISDFTGVEFRGKYSFQYIQNAVFENCTFDTKDAFWHGHNVTVRNSW